MQPGRPPFKGLPAASILAPSSVAATPGNNLRPRPMTPQPPVPNGAQTPEMAAWQPKGALFRGAQPPPTSPLLGQGRSIGQMVPPLGDVGMKPDGLGSSSAPAGFASPSIAAPP